MSEIPPTQTAPPPRAPTPSPLSGLMPQRSAGLKLLLVCGLALLMAIPAFFVYMVVHERSSGQQMAVQQVSESVGGQQAVLGPVLALPYARAPNPKRPSDVVYGIAIAYAEEGKAVVDVDVTEKTRGIHTVPIFAADITFDATFDPDALRGALPSDAEPIWADARLYLGVSDTRGIKEAIDVTVNGRAIQMEPAGSRRNFSGDGYNPVPDSGLNLASGEIPTLELATEPLKVRATTKLTGAQRFAIGPFAKDTSMTMTSNWPDPSFTGGVLPSSHNVAEMEETFTAEWRVPYMARGIAGAGPRMVLNQVSGWGERDMAVRFIKEANPYQSVQRALKYAAMFVGFVFLAYFLFEVTSGARAHPAQYVLVGLAQTIFYLLLLAFSERIGFDLAFLFAATMTVTLTAGYAMSVFRSRKYGLRAFGILAGIYALIYVLMRAEGQALLAGAIASFIAIALTMYMTRNVDWYGERKTLTA